MKHTKVNLRVDDIKEIIETFELIKYVNRGPLCPDEKKMINRILRQCKKALNFDN